MTNKRKWTERMKKLRLGHQPLTHINRKAEFQWGLMKEHPGLRYKFRKPDNLTILTCHNYGEKPLFELNMDYLGIMGYVVLRWPREKPFRTAHRLKLVRDYLRSGANKTDFVLFCDARDVIFSDDPMKVIDVLENGNCDLLFCSTMFKGGWACMPEVFAWTQTVVKKRGRYLNAGTYVGEWDFTLEVLERAMYFLTDDSLTAEEHNATGYGINTDDLCKGLPDFPMGATDQHILRYIHREFWPRMDVDYMNQLVYRN